MQEFLIPTTNSANQELASSSIRNRSFLYNQEKNTLYLKYNDALKSFSADVDNKNIITRNIDGSDLVSLADDVNVKTTTVSPDSLIINKCSILAEKAITDLKSIYLIIRVSDEYNEGFCGELFRFGENVSEMYHVVVSCKEKPEIFGSSNNGKTASINKYSYAGGTYFGISFNDTTTSNLYFHGFNTIKNLAPPNYTNYRDSQITLLEG